MHKGAIRIRPWSAAFLVTLLTLPASAQETPPPTSVDHAAEHTDAPKTEEQSSAEVHFKRALKLFDEGDFKLALVEFQRSYELNPNYRVLYNIGEVQFQLGHYADARRSLTRYTAEGGERIQGRRRAEVDRDLEALKLRTANLRVEVDVPDADVLIDGERIGRSPIRDAELVDAGNHRVEAKRVGFVATADSITLVGGDEKSIRLHLEPVAKAPEAPVGPDPNASRGLGPVWIGWGITAAFAVATVAVGVAWLNAHQNLADLKSRQSTQDARDSQLRTVDTLRITTIAAGGATVIAAGVSLYFMLRRSSANHGRLSFPLGPIVF